MGALETVVSDIVDEVDATDQLHREQPSPSVGNELVEDHEVVVDHAGECSELLFEAIQGGRVVDPVQRFQGDDRVTVLVVHLIDHAKAAGAQTAPDTEPVSPREFHAGFIHRGRRHYSAVCRSDNAGSDSRAGRLSADVHQRRLDGAPDKLRGVLGQPSPGP